MAFSDESSLLHQLSIGNEKAFGKLHDLYRPDLYRFVYKFIKSPDLSNDICQEVFLKIWEDRQAVKEIQSFRSYLFTITRNHTFNTLKRAAVEDRVKNSIIKSYRVSKNDTEDVVLSKEYQRFLQSVIDTLPPQSRAVFALCRQQEKSYEEAAKILGISSNAIKKHMVKSMKTIRFAVERDMGIAFGVFIEILSQSSDFLLISDL